MRGGLGEAEKAKILRSLRGLRELYGPKTVVLVCFCFVFKGFRECYGPKNSGE